MPFKASCATQSNSKSREKKKGKYLFYMLKVC